MLRFGFERTMALNRVEALISPDNHASLRVAERSARVGADRRSVAAFAGRPVASCTLGLREEGGLRPAGRVSGRPQNGLMFAILPAEWTGLHHRQPGRDGCPYDL